MRPLTTSSGAGSTRATLSCVRCSERKVKCDKQNPCSTCIRHNVQCFFRAPKPSRRKKRLVSLEWVDERMQRYEALLRERGIDLNQISSTTEVEPHRARPPQSTVAGPQATTFEPQILRGQSGTKFVDNNLWSRVAEEIHNGEDTAQGDSASDASDSEASDDDFAYAIGWKTSINALSHPPPSIIHRLWQTFVENVNPLTKLVHLPTLQPAIEKAVANLEHVPRGFEALMFAIYSMAVLSLPDSECESMLGEARAILLSRYVAATKAALLRAKFMSSTSIVVLQASLLHLLSIRDASEPRAVWTLTGLVIRVAEGMGVHVDGTFLGLPPFETEIYRRIWWQLRMHDFRASELSGQGKLRAFDVDETSPKLPANISDSDMYPGMPHAVPESNRPTEMIWIMFRTELANFAATHGGKMKKTGKAVFSSEEYAAVDDLKFKDDLIKELEDMIKTKHLRFCDPSQPLQLLTLLGARAAANLIRFQAHHPRRWAHLDHVPTSEQEFVWRGVLSILEQYKMMQANPQLRRFAWNFPYFIQWTAVIHALDTLRTNPLHSDASKAWHLIDCLYENNSDMLLSMKRPIFVAVGNLCLKAFDARDTILSRENQKFSVAPNYIIMLREQRQAAKERREATTTRRKKHDDTSVAKGSVQDNEVMGLDVDLGSLEILAPAQSQLQAVANPPPHSTQASARTQDDAFWLNDAVNDNFLNSETGDSMDLTTSLDLAQDFWLDDPAGGILDWEQWDAWLGHTDPGRGALGTRPGGGLA